MRGSAEQTVFEGKHRPIPWETAEEEYFRAPSNTDLATDPLTESCEKSATSQSPKTHATFHITFKQ